MTLKLILTVMAISIPTTGAAQTPAFSAVATESCLQETINQAERVACIGRASNACLTDPANGSGSYLESYCYRQEAEYWGDRLNAHYGMIVDDPNSNNTALIDALRNLQQAWIVYRDVQCQAVADGWGEGTGRVPAHAECLMWNTAEQALYLEARR